jgi:uncharacterized membrane protein YhaH (DUF805 family)
MAAHANDFWTTLFSLRGRSGRKRFWLTVLLQFAALLAVGGLVVALSSALLPFASVPLGVALLVGSFALSLCNSIKRIHDIGYSGWWVAPFYLVSLMMSLIPAIGGGFGLICLILLGTLPGTQGTNKFGDPPSPAPGQVAEEQAAA